MAPGLPKGNLSSSSPQKLSQDHRTSEAQDPQYLLVGCDHFAEGETEAQGRAVTSSLSHCMAGHRALIRWNRRSGFWSPSLSAGCPSASAMAVRGTRPAQGRPTCRGSWSARKEPMRLQESPPIQPRRNHTDSAWSMLPILQALMYWLRQRGKHMLRGQGRGVALTSRRLPDETTTGQWGRSSRRRGGRPGAHPSRRRGPCEHYSHPPPQHPGVSQWGPGVFTGS